MLSDEEVQHEFVDESCQLRLHVTKPNESEDAESSGMRRHRNIENIRNCDIFVKSNTFLCFADVHLFKFHCSAKRQFNVEAITNPLIIRYNTKEHYYELQLPCKPQTAAEEQREQSRRIVATKATNAHASLRASAAKVAPNLWQLKRLTDQCRLKQDEGEELLKLDANFAYGFASNFRGRLETALEGYDSLRITAPHTASPLQRAIDREIHEMRDFARDAYKMNFIEMEVPEGHDNPLFFSVNFDEACGDQQLKRVIADAKQLRADVMELNFLETLILCRKEYALNSDNALLLETYSNGALVSLARYTMHQSNWFRFGTLLLGLRQLSLKRYDSILSNLFHSVVKDILKTI